MVGQPGRAPLDAAGLRCALLAPDGLWTDLRVLADTGSTNADVAEAARAGAPAGLVVTAEHQRAGRGRAGRGWSSPPGAGLAVSVLLRPDVPTTRWGSLPLLAGVALAEAVAATGTTGPEPALKWPNDLLLGGGKCGGILSELVGDAVVLGIGVNVSLRADELPPPAPDALPATSLLLAGGTPGGASPTGVDRAQLLVAVLRRLARWYGRWRGAGGDAEHSGLRESYVARCATVGQRVRAMLPGGGVRTGMADTVDPDGRLVVRAPDGVHVLAAGDITHLRAA